MRRIETVCRDVVHACRSLRRATGFTAAAVATLAVGIGATTAVFSVVSATLLRPLPYPDPDELVVVWQEYTSRGWGVVPVSHPNFVSIARETTRLRSVAGLEFRPIALTGNAEPEMLAGVAVTRGAFQVLGVPAMLGRPLLAADNDPGAPRVAVLSDALWRRRFGADAGIIGRSLVLNGEARTVVGVMPRGFGFPPRFRTSVGGNPLTVPAADLWIPLELDARAEMAGTRRLFVVGRLASGTTLDAARQEAAIIASRLLSEFPGPANTGLTLALRSLHAEVAGKVRAPLLLLFGAVGLVVLIACANVASMLMARGVARRREAAIRLALGASRADLIRHAMTECVLLSVVSGAAGLLLASWLTAALSASIARQIPQLEAIPLDWRVLAFVSLLSIGGAAVFGLAPSLRAASMALRERVSPTLADTPARVRRSYGRLLLTGEAALSLLLLIAAGLFARSFLALVTVDPGFDPARLLAIQFDLPASRYQTLDQRRSFHAQLVSRIGSLPGVRAVGVTNQVPLTGGSGTGGLNIDGRSTPPDERPHAAQRIVDAGYFAAVGAAVVRGRGFQESDGASAPPVAVINSTAARQFWPAEDPIGQRVQPDGVGEWLTVVGVVEDVRHSSLDSAPHPEVYWPFAQRPLLPSPAAPSLPLGVIVRGELSPEALTAAIRRAVREIDAGLPATVIGTFDDLVSASLAESRFYTTTMSLFAAFGLLVAASGLYGVLTFLVAQRRREIGLRMALGAPRRQVVFMVLRDGLLPVVTGCGIGMALALSVRQVVAAELYEAPATDTVTLSAVCVLLFVVALCACYVPAQRAARIDPAATLRAE